MKRRVGIYGVTPEALRLIEQLAGNPRVEVVRVYTSDPNALLEVAQTFDGGFTDFLLLIGTDDFSTFIGPDDLAIVVDASGTDAFRERAPDAIRRGVQIVTPRAARLLWGHDLNPRDRKAELIQVLSEMVESVELSADSDELFSRMLEIAVDITGAEGGSLMLLDPDRQDLHIRVATGVERELWPKIRVPLGEGIAGQAAATRESIHIAGLADRERFEVVRERLDIAAALCVPLIDKDRLLGVLNLHHGSQTDAFSDADFAFVEELAELDAQIIARAEEQAVLRDQAARYTAVREIQTILASTDPIPARLHELCRFVSRTTGDGIAQLYLLDPDLHELRLAGSSVCPDPSGAAMSTPVGVGIDGIVAQTSRPAFLHSDGARFELASLPLRARGTRIGVLSIHGPARPQPARTPRDLLIEISRAMAEGIAQLTREERTRERANRLSAIHEAGAQLLAARAHEEIARAQGRDAGLAVCVVEVEDATAQAAPATPADRAHVCARVAAALDASTRDFDVVCQRSETSFTVLLPDPGSNPGDRIYSLARAVNDCLARDERLADPDRVALGFGYAIHPFDGEDWESLLRAATPPRIRTV